jgi:hypothetical protein
MSPAAPVCALYACIPLVFLCALLLIISESKTTRKSAYVAGFPHLGLLRIDERKDKIKAVILQEGVQPEATALRRMITS